MSCSTPSFLRPKKLYATAGAAAGALGKSMASRGSMSLQRPQISDKRRTVENRTSEEHQELDEQVLLVGGDLVEAKLLATGLNIVRSDTRTDVGVEPLLGHGGVLAFFLLVGLLPELRVKSVTGGLGDSNVATCDEPAMTSSSACWRGSRPAPPESRAWDLCKWKCTFAEQCTRLNRGCQSYTLP